MPKTDHITPRAAATLLGITPDAVRKLCQLKKLTGRKYNGHHWRIDQASVEAWRTRKHKAGEQLPCVK